ncbi:MAG: 1,4-dihydroxy-2-naphthoate polyprenyltransferase [Polyangiaceae bacterium]|nr:1,4-dihydroxy-2-naphthoate polyprenyltransferase [Polyangiaceae bacterium]
MTKTLPLPGSMGAWVMASRPATLPVAVAPVAVGAAVASALGALRWPAALAALAGALFIQIGTNFANDVFDAEKGADDEQRVGPPRAVQKGLLTPGAVRIGMAVAFGLATLLGIYLAVVGGPVIVAIGIASILSGIAYTGGPYPLGYNGLGDVFVFVFFGPVAVVGTTWVAAGQAPAAAFAASVPVGALATAVLVINNVRDRVGDARTGKRTLVVRYGRLFGLIEHAALHAAAALAPVIGVILGWLPATSLIALPTLALGLGITRALATREGAELNPLLARQAKILLAFSALLAAGIAVGA